MRILLLFIFSVLAVSAQPLTLYRSASAPAGTCNTQSGVRVITSSGVIWTCAATTWTQITATIAHTTNTLRGDGSGNAVAVSGTATDCVLVDGTSGACGSGGSGTVTSVALSTNLGTVTGSPVTTSGTLTNTVSAAQVVGLFSACSGTQYLGADGACHTPTSGTVTSVATTSPITGGTITTTGTIACATCVTSAAALTANLPVFGAGSQASVVGTRSGNTTEVATASGSFTAGNCPQGDANGNLVDSGIPCTGGGGGGTGGNIITANWTTLGSTATRTNHASSITILGTTSATNRVDGVCHTVSAGDFSYTLVFLVSLPVGATGPPAILAGFTDGTKTEGAGAGADVAPFITGQNLKNTAISGGTVTAANGAVAGADHNASSNPVYVTLTRTGTALAGSVSHNGGVTYDAIFNDTTPFLTASSICVYIVSRGSIVVEQFTLVTSSLP